MLFNATTFPADEGVFENIHKMIRGVIDQNSMSPIDATVQTGHVLRPGTPMAPVPGTSKYKPIRRTKLTQAGGGSTTVHVENATPFNVGDSIVTFTALNVACSAANVITAVSTSANTITLTSASSAANGDYLEVAENGIHALSTAAYPTLPYDCGILKELEGLRLWNGTLVDVPGIIVTDGSIRIGGLKGPGTAAFDQLLRTQIPGILFIPTAPGTGS